MNVVWMLWSTTTQINLIDHGESGQAVHKSGNISTRGMRKWSNEAPLTNTD